MNPDEKKDCLIVALPDAATAAVAACAFGAGSGALTTMDTRSDLPGFATLVAVTVTTVSAVTFGARYRPELVIVPAVADHRTATFGVFFIRAVNCKVCDDTTEAMSGVILTATDELAAWPMLKLDTNVNASASTANTRGDWDLMTSNLQILFRNTREAARTN